MWCIFATTNKLGINPVGKTENINKTKKYCGPKYQQTKN